MANIMMFVMKTFNMETLIPLSAGVKTKIAPRAFNITLLSKDIEAGIVRYNLYPLAAAAMARPIPVLPDVGSTRIVLPIHIYIHMEIKYTRI
jgi:hypothetical protein